MNDKLKAGAQKINRIMAYLKSTKSSRPYVVLVACYEMLDDAMDDIDSEFTIQTQLCYDLHFDIGRGCCKLGSM
jgi:hypothetical protein